MNQRCAVDEDERRISVEFERRREEREENVQHGALSYSHDFGSFR